MKIHLLSAVLMKAAAAEQIIYGDYLEFVIFFYSKGGAGVDVIPDGTISDEVHVMSAFKMPPERSKCLFSESQPTPGQ